MIVGDLLSLTGNSVTQIRHGCFNDSYCRGCRGIIKTHLIYEERHVTYDRVLFYIVYDTLMVLIG